jgi:molybdate transport system permease protein
MPLDWSPLWLALRYAGVATLLAILAGLPLAWLLAHHRFPGCEMLDAVASLPLVLPPAVLVYYLLASSGHWPRHFSWHVAVAISAIYTLPLLLRMTRAGLAALDPSFENAARGLGAGELRIFWAVTLPLTWRALFAALLAAFARAFADFGATALLASDSSGGDTLAWLILPIAAIALAALYVGNRVHSGQVPA